MLPRKLRLPFIEAQSLFKTGKTAQNENIKLAWLINNVGSSRFAIQAPKRVNKKAVDRNRVKRMVSVALMELIPLLKQPIDGLVIVKRPLEGYKTQDVTKMLYPLFVNTGLI